jgi:hypothetical protein
MKKRCHRCKRQFTPKTGNQIFCTKLCHKLFKQEHFERKIFLKNCEICAKEFYGSNSQAKYCSWDCKEIARKQNYNTKIKSARKGQKELSEIKAIKCVCPGCLVDFSSCPDEGLLMIFERSHFHGVQCHERSKKTFWACRVCNGEQSRVCGYYEKGQFIKTCDQ